MQTFKMLRWSVAILFVCNAIWIFTYGIGFLHLTPDPLPPLLDWATDSPVLRVFDFIAPMFWLGVWITALSVSSIAAFPWHTLSSLLYLSAAISLFFGFKRSGKFIALVCWINAVSILIGVFVVNWYDFWKYPRFILYLPIFAGYAYLGHFFYRHFSREIQTAK